MAKPPNNPFEKIANPAEESGNIKETADLTVKLLDKRYTQKKLKVLRGVHPKSHGCLEAFFEIRHDIPPEHRVGLFAQPGRRYRAWVRFSNAAVKVAHDLGSPPDPKIGGSRGMAVKVLGVDGRVLLEDDGARNQDFLMINTPAFAFIDTKQYLTLNRALEQSGDNEKIAVGAVLQPLLDPSKPSTPAEKLRAKKSLDAIQAIQAKPVANPTEVSYFGAAPFLFGADHVMRFAAVPWGGEEPQAVPEKAGPSYLRRAVRRTVKRREDICFDFKVQVRGKNDKGLGIEDATAVWDDRKTPFVAVARVIIPSPRGRPDADPNEAWARREKRCEKMAFTPWHCLAAHQPLGSINRLRKAVYIASATKRGSAKPGGRRRARERS